MALTTVPASLSATALTLTTAAQPNITSVGTLTSLTVDDITINGSTISDAADFLLDVGGNIVLDSDTGVLQVRDGGTVFYQLAKSSDNVRLTSFIQDGDMEFRGNDGGSYFTALTLDMSNAGFATFNSGVITETELYFNTSGTTAGYLYNDSLDFVVRNFTQDKDIIFKGNDGGSVITAMTIDMSAAGNVGIGDSAPSEKLNVAGNIMLEGSDQYLYLTNVGTGNSGIYIRGNTASSYLRSHSTGKFTWEVTGSQKMELDANGNLGIAQTPSGNFPLEITKVGGDAININSAADFSGIRMTDNNHSFALRNAANKFFIYDVTNTTQRVTLDDSGNFGIGTASPNGNGQLTINSASNTSPQIVFTENNTAKWLIGHRHDDDRFRFYDLANSAERLSIDSNGNVGIGTNSPGAVRLYSTTAASGNLAGLFTNTHASGSYGLKVQAGSSSSNYGFVVTDKDNSNPTHFYVRGDGQVGINTNSPAGTLHTVARSGTTALVVTGVASNNIATFARSTGQTLGIKELGAGALELESSTSLGYDVGSGYNHEFMVGGSQVFKIYSDGKVDIKNSGTDKIVRFINTGSGTQGITIGSTTSGSTGTGVHIGHQGTKAFIHPYNYAAGAYQQMEIACSDFVLKVNGSASGMSMDTSANATFYGDVKINDANDRLIQNGTAREAKGGYIQGNQTVSFTINHTAQATMHVRCGFNHYGLLGYGCVFDQVFANGPGGMTQRSTPLINDTSTLGGGWSLTRVDSQNVTVSKSAGSYVGGGYYYIIVEGANL